MKKVVFTFAIAALLLGTSGSAIAQGVSVNTSGTDPDASAVLDVSSTTQGMLVPRMTAAQRGLIGSPATGLLVYQTDASAGFYFYNGSSWVSLSTSTGTVTNTSVVNANGFSGSVSNSTTTPAITVSTTVNGIIKGNGTAMSAAGSSDLPAISLTGDVTGSAAGGSIGTTIGANAVTYGKMQNVSATSKILGSSSTTTPVQELTIGSGLTLTGTTLTASGGASVADLSTQKIGLTAINGVATTAMRSDAAPALDQAIAPTWTGLHIFQNGITTTGTAALSFGADASAQTISIGTGAAAKAVTLGSSNTTSTTTIQSGSGGVLVNTTTTAPTKIGNSTGKTFLPEFNAGATYTSVLTIDRNTGQIGTGSTLVGIKFITASVGATSFDAGTTSIVVELVGGGGAGGGIPASTSAGGGGGGAGAYCKGFVTGLTNTSTFTATIGSGGAGVSNGAGGSGSATSFTSGATFTAAGGSGGQAGVGSGTTTAAAGGAAGGTGSINFAGAPGGVGSAGGYHGAEGGATPFGGAGTSTGSYNSSTPGNAARPNSGSGGSGAANFANSGNQPGGSGAAGVVIIYEYR